MTDDKTFSRLEKLFDIGMLADSKVLIAGCGSGGSHVALQLAMSGIANFTLVDNDILEIENVIRHACGRRFIGQRKVDALESAILDRNPAASISKLHVDLLNSAEAEAAIRNSTVVVSATDSDPARYKINEICVANGIPFVVGRVFTRGIGGEVFGYRPGIGGCLACLEAVLERASFRKGTREIDLVTEDEREKMYGMEIPEIKDSPGLNVDIAFITSFHTRYVLDAIADRLKARPKFLAPIPENYIVWGNRPIAPFNKHFQLQRVTLNPQDGCKICKQSAV
ncbi:MAG TPA: ThiF family adenylyltransferase [Elusimicrobiota bacterium]|nr:ThiF family adenylyltransferase [Elusimicrobiota bacterium]